MKAVGYIRVSTLEQATSGVSLAAQHEAIEGYSGFKELELIEMVVDAGVSAGKPLSSRQGGLKLLELVEREDVVAVVAYGLDRLFRDAADCLAVTKLWDSFGVDLHLISLGGQTVDTSTAMGRFFLTVMAGVAEMERNLIIERTRAAMVHLRNKGRRISATPYGFSLHEDGLHLVPSAKEQKTIKAARRLRKKGVSLRKIADTLHAKGHTARSGKPFHPMQVKRLVESDWV
jgi:DNA invertase Pin-like site-specific DNA recombinase